MAEDYWHSCSCPWFVFRNIHSYKDMDCFINEELSEITAPKVIDSIKVLGKSGKLHRSFGDYDSFDYPIEMQLVEFDRLEDVKRWLSGSGKLILHTDPDKYREAIVTFNGQPRPYTNEMGAFWRFTVNFECQPFKRTLREYFVSLQNGVNIIEDPGTEIARPLFEVESNGNELKIETNGALFTVKNPKKDGVITIDSEKRLAIQNRSFLKTYGELPTLNPGKNILKIQGVKTIRMMNRSVWI
ncbi:phage tail protein [Enterococcus sp. DIV1444a]|uniref:phage tail protein n=1 Tax=Enterococcus sp. DIV1444a TaxID=2774679 RepID=UPI003729B8A2